MNLVRKNEQIGKCIPVLPTGAASVGCRLFRKATNIYCLQRKCERMTNTSLSLKYSLRDLNPMAKYNKTQ